MPFLFSARRRAAGMALLLTSIVSAGCGRSDAETTAAIEAQLQKDPVTAPLDLSVTVTRGVAVLSGETQKDEEQARALDIARAVVGVSEVVNAMEIDPDAQLADAVKSALAAQPDLASVPFDVDSQDGRVRLISDATNAEQRERALAVARAVDGVKDVEDRMK